MLARQQDIPEESKPTAPKKAPVGLFARFFKCGCRAMPSQNVIVPANPTIQAPADGKEEKLIADGFTVSIPATIECKAIISHEIGAGGFAKVYKASWTGFTIAVKCLESPTLRNIHRFRQEAAKMAELQRLGLSCMPNYYGYHEKTGVGRYHIYMEFLPGQTLFQLASDYYHNGRLIPTETAVTVLTKATEACTEISQHDIVHADLKTENMILTSGGKVKLIDWCFAIKLGDTTEYKSTFNCGTIPFSSPEILANNTYSLSSDVFAMGSVICIFANESLPFHDVNHDEAIEKVKNGQRHPLSNDCHPFFAGLIGKCWQQKPELRPSMKEINVELSAFKNTYPKPQ